MSVAPRTAAATEAVQQRAAERAIFDDAKLSKAVRIVRTAISRGRLAIPDVVPYSADAPVELRSAPGERAGGR